MMSSPDNQIDYDDNMPVKVEPEGVGLAESDDDDDEALICGEIRPDLDGERTEDVEESENENFLRCANCCLFLSTGELARSSNFHEFLPLELHSIESGDLIDIEIIDAVSDVFKLQQSYKEFYQRHDIYFCATCVTLLADLYKLYHDFKTLAIKSNSLLRPFINPTHKVRTLDSIKTRIKKDSRSHVNVKQNRKTSRTRTLPKKLQSSSSSENETNEDKHNTLTSECPSDNWSDMDETSNRNASNTKTKRKTGSKEQPRCDACNVTFKFPIQLVNHLRSKIHRSVTENSGISVMDSGKLFKSETGINLGSTFASRSSPLASATLERDLCCPQLNCNKRFVRRNLLQRHMKVHWVDGGCDRCGKKFKTLGGLKIHYASHVRDDQKHACKLCGKKFRKQEGLDMHVKTDHGGFKPHHCPQCDKTFRLKDKLKLHIMVIHEKRKPFPCSKCEKSFRTKYHLKIHDVSQHIQGGDTSIGCSQCKRKFLNKEALEKHVLVHGQEKPYVCDSCGKGFQTAARLKLHEKSHQEVPSCLCPICGRAYKHIRDLRLHEVVHQDESTFRFGCGDCSRRFYRIDLLRVHQSNEKHFSPEIIGPTMSKVLPNKELELAINDSILDDDDDEEDENETDTENPPLPASPPQPKKRLKLVKDSRITAHEKDITLVHPHATTVIYPSNVVQVQLDQSNIVTSAGIKTNTATLLSSSSPYPNSTSITQQRPNIELPASYFITQRDRQNILHHPTIQIQTISSGGVPSQIQFGNQTVFTAHPISMSNASVVEQTGFDFINSFNLG